MEHRLSAVSNYCRNKNNLPTIGSAFSLDYEKVLEVKSDRVFLEQTSDMRIQSHLKKLGIKFSTFKFLTLKEIKESAYKISKILKADTKKLDQHFRKLKDLKKQILKSPKVLLVIGEDLKSGEIIGLRAVSGKSFYSDLLSLVGARNILKDSEVSYPMLDREMLSRLKPDLVLRIGQAKLSHHIREAWKKLEVADSVKFMLAPEYVIPGPQVLNTYLKMKEVIHEVR